MMPKLTGRPVDADQGTAGALRPIIGRLSDEFVGLSHNTVERCVVDVRTRADHLGLAITAAQVERIAREHLTGVVKSEPPSGRPV